MGGKKTFQRMALRIDCRVIERDQSSNGLLGCLDGLEVGGNFVGGHGTTFSRPVPQGSYTV